MSCSCIYGQGTLECGPRNLSAAGCCLFDSLQPPTHPTHASFCTGVVPSSKKLQQQAATRFIITTFFEMQVSCTEEKRSERFQAT